MFFLFVCYAIALILVYQFRWIFYFSERGIFVVPFKFKIYCLILRISNFGISPVYRITPTFCYIYKLKSIRTTANNYRFLFWSPLRVYFTHPMLNGRYYTRVVNVTLNFAVILFSIPPALEQFNLLSLNKVHLD